MAKRARSTRAASAEGSVATADPDDNESPDGQTAASPGVLGAGEGDSEFEDARVHHDALGVARPTSVDADGKPTKEKEKTPSEYVSLAKAYGLKGKDVVSYNEKNKTVLLSNGAKLQLSKSGKTVRHLAGPQPPSDLKLDVQDARQRSPLVGTAAAINQPATVDEDDPAALKDERAALKARLAEIDEELGDEDEEETEEEE